VGHLFMGFLERDHGRADRAEQGRASVFAWECKFERFRG
jgi:hypothetical protein